MGFYDDPSFSFYSEPQQYDLSWLDQYQQPQVTDDGNYYTPESDAYYEPPVEPAPAPPVNPMYGTYPTPESDAYYTPTPEPGQSGGSIVPDWLKAAGKGLASYAANNPKDVLGMGLGAGMGLYGLLKSPDKIAKPDLSSANAANAALQARLDSTQGLNAAAAAKLQAQIGGDYGDYADAAGARSGATAKLRELMANGPDYAMLPEEQRALAELDQKWASKGMLGSSLHNAEKQALTDSFRNNALARYQSQLKALTDTAANFSNQTSQQFQNTGNVVNQGQNTAIQGLSNLANQGLNQAKLNTDVAASNQKLQADRSNQLLQAGGQLFGRSMSDPAEELRKLNASLGGARK